MTRFTKDFHVYTLTEMMLGVRLVSGDPRTASKQKEFRCPSSCSYNNRYDDFIASRINEASPDFHAGVPAATGTAGQLDGRHDSLSNEVNSETNGGRSYSFAAHVEP